jgi:hypothetical protein
MRERTEISAASMNSIIIYKLSQIMNNRKANETSEIYSLNFTNVSTHQEISVYIKYLY